MSDLQCPARVFLARDDLPSERVEAVVEGEHIAGRYAVPAGEPADSSWLDGVADRHRGEAVLVVAPVEVLTAWLLGAGRRVQPVDVLAFDIDSDGWRARAVVTGPIPIQRPHGSEQA
jgi:hypothetical protein